MNVSIPLQMDLVLRVSGLLRNPYKLASEPPRNSRRRTEVINFSIGRRTASHQRWRNASLELLFQTWIRSAKLGGSGKLTVKLLDISPAGDAGRLRTVRWNLLYAFVRQGASEG